MHELALFHPAGRLGQPGNPFGKDIANVALFRALARYGGYRKVSILNQPELSASELSDTLLPTGSDQISVVSAPLHNTDLPAQAGVLLRGQPYLSELAWTRCQAGCQQDYSLVGLIHTTAPPAVRELIGAASVAPVEPWDALICTSPAVQQGINRLFDNYDEYLRERLGATRAVRPQLPLIPLAVDVEAIQAAAENQALGQSLRHNLNLPDDALVVLWVGRLSYYEKAFPQPMFLALDIAAQQVDQPVHFLMAGWFPGGENDRRLYEQAASAYSPHLHVHFLDGNDPSIVNACWSAADVFFSLVDNIQETFGLTPVEAMAAGLPIVASDWDGYSFTIRDGEDGFLVPTLAGSAPKLDSFLATLHSLGLESYQTYVGAVAQHTSVDVGCAASALASLLMSADLRRRMGASARKRAQACFSWPVVVDQYNELFTQLAHQRKLSLVDRSVLNYYSHPLRGQPFRDFHGFATQVLTPEHRVSLANGIELQTSLRRIFSVELDRRFPGLRAQPQETVYLLKLITQKPAQSVADLLAEFPSARAEHIVLTIIWLSKLGLLQCLPCHDV